MKKFISILGSTGSVGSSTLNIIDLKKGYFTPHIFSANKNYKYIDITENMEFEIWGVITGAVRKFK